MAVTPSTMLPLGTKAPNFRLPDPEGKLVSLDDFKDSPALLVAFICNHCPFVQHIRVRFGCVRQGIPGQRRGHCRNQLQRYCDKSGDTPEKMAEEAKQFGYVFPYLFDETQEVAKAYHAACTPDLFLFDRTGTCWSIAGSSIAAGQATEFP